MIRIDAAWIAVEPLDMRSGVDTALTRVVSVFGEARSHHAYLFLNRRANRLKVLVHDGCGLRVCAKRLEGGRLAWPQSGAVEMDVLGLQAVLSGFELRARRHWYRRSLTSVPEGSSQP